MIKKMKNGWIAMGIALIIGGFTFCSNTHSYAKAAIGEMPEIVIKNYTYMDGIKVDISWNNGTQQVSECIEDHSEAVIHPDTGSVYKLLINGQMSNGQNFSEEFGGLTGKKQTVYLEMDENAEISVGIASND